MDKKACNTSECPYQRVLARTCTLSNYIYEACGLRSPVKPKLPPKPSQEWLDRHGVHLTGEFKVPKTKQDLHFYNERVVPHLGYEHSIHRKWIVEKNVHDYDPVEYPVYCENGQLFVRVECHKTVDAVAGTGYFGRTLTHFKKDSDPDDWSYEVTVHPEDPDNSTGQLEIFNTAVFQRLPEIKHNDS